MGNLFAFLVLLLTPFLVGWALYCFVFMGADAVDGDVIAAAILQEPKA